MHVMRGGLRLPSLNLAIAVLPILKVMFGLIIIIFDEMSPDNKTTLQNVLTL